MTAKDKLCHSDPAETISLSLPTGHRRFSLHIATGILCFVLALLFYYGAVLRVEFKRTYLTDLYPYPDAVEYFAQANSILKDGAPTIQIGYDKLPSRYPPGYPILMIPWLKVLPQRDIILAPFRTNQTIGLLLLLGCFALYLRIGRPLAGGLAALLLATQPAFATYSRSPMSDLSSAAATVLAFALVYFGLASRRRWPIYCAAVVLGVSLSIRPQLLFFAPLLISMALFPVCRSRAKWLLHCVLVILTFALAASPYFILNTFEFGHPLKTGYDFWVPWFTEKQMPFSVHSVPHQLAMIWSEVTASWDQFRVANLFGTGTYIVPTFVLLSVLGLPFLQFRRFEISALLAGTVFFVATATYRFVDPRFYLPILFLLVALAVLPAEWAVGAALKMRFSISTLGVLMIFLLTCVGYPSQSGFEPKRNRSQAWDALHYANDKGTPQRYEAQNEFLSTFRHAPGIVLSDIEPPYLNALLPKPFVAAPIDDHHNYCFSRLWHYGKVEATRLVQSGLDHATAVYALLVPSPDDDKDIQRLPSIQGYSWKRSKKSNSRAVIMTLTKDTAAPTLDSASRSVEMPNKALGTHLLLQ
jgi:4-amino-4-deoxy-L-arabinose transferase-like glycosyltransferase